MKQFGIRITLTDTNPLREPHLLGADWEAFRWYANESERDAGLLDMDRQLPIYRAGDEPRHVLTRVERNVSDA